MVLYSAVSSPLDRSKRFTLYRGYSLLIICSKYSINKSTCVSCNILTAILSVIRKSDYESDTPIGATSCG